MLTQDQNERLTRVGPGTPAGELLRRYWQPVCPAGELTDEAPIKRIRMLDEDLVAFRDASGRYGVVRNRCAHRGVALHYGFVEEDGIRCPYHGWKYDCTGQCIEQPFEPDDSPLRSEAKLHAYPVEKLAGLLFIYMGPNPAEAPLLPRWDVLVREDGKRKIQIRPTVRCNWLQVQENTVDLTHTYFLHGHMNEVRDLKLRGAEYYHRPIKSFDWSYCEWGVEKVMEYGGDDPEIEIRPPLIFPNILRIPSGPVEAMHWRVPIDDTHTRVVWMGFMPSKDGSVEMREDEDPPHDYVEDNDGENGEYHLTSFNSHDQMAWETQGAVFDRSKELLGTTDRGIVMFRKMLDEQIALVEEGKMPTVAVVRDAEKNRLIDFPDATSPVGGLEELSVLKSRKDREQRFFK